jgi:hypothetical protein
MKFTDLLMLGSCGLYFTVRWHPEPLWGARRLGPGRHSLDLGRLSLVVENLRPRSRRPKPKYRVGQRVSVRVPHPYNVGAYTWSGVIERVADAGEAGETSWEYWVSDNPGGEFPLLAWESEITPLEPS